MSLTKYIKKAEVPAASPVGSPIFKSISRDSMSPRFTDPNASTYIDPIEKPEFDNVTQQYLQNRTPLTSATGQAMTTGHGKSKRDLFVDHNARQGQGGVKQRPVAPDSLYPNSYKGVPHITSKKGRRGWEGGIVFAAPQDELVVTNYGTEDGAEDSYETRELVGEDGKMAYKFNDPYAMWGKYEQLRSENPDGTFDLQGTGPMWDEGGEEEFLAGYKKSPFFYKQPEGYDRDKTIADVRARMLERFDPNDPDSKRVNFIPGYTRGQYEDGTGDPTTAPSASFSASSTTAPSASSSASNTTAAPTTPPATPPAEPEPLPKGLLFGALDERPEGADTVLKNQASEYTEQIARQKQIQARAKADRLADAKRKAQGYDWSSLLKPGLMGAGIGGAAGAGIQMWRRSQVIDDLIEQGYTEEEAEEMAPSILSGAGYGALAGAGLGAGYQHLTA